MRGSGLEDLIRRLRGPRTEYFLIKGKTELLDPSKYPFEKGMLPVFCKYIDAKMQPLKAYISGNRSIVFPSDSAWFKAKSIGIPSGRSSPTYKDGKLYTFFLTNASIGSGSLIWGFSEVKEALNEVKWMKKAKELDLRVTEPVGMGIYENIFVIDLKDRSDLFSYLKRTSLEDLMNRFHKEARKTEGACVFCWEPTDIRVDEILYAFSIPGIENILGRDDCRDYLKWLGSSCGYNLRLHHDNCIMHGTVQVGPGFMTNSHVANHLVGEETTWITDYHMAGEVKNEDIKRMEVFCLCHVMNPLPHAEVIARSRFARDEFPRFELYELLLSPSYEAITSLGEIGLRTPKAGLTEAFIDGIELGYYKRRIFEVESKLKRKMLRKSILIKEKIWEILKIPKRMQRGVDYFHARLYSRKLTDQDYRELSRAISN